MENFMENYDVIDIANYFISKSIKANCNDLTPMKLQKLLFYAYGWYIALTEKQLFTSPIYAWPYGPVVDSVYHATKRYGADNIDETINSWLDIKGTKFDDNIDDRTKTFLNRIWNAYSKYTPFELSNATHAENTPWAKATNNGKNIKQNIIIDNDVIKQYFDDQYEALNKSNG